MRRYAIRATADAAGPLAASTTQEQAVQVHWCGMRNTVQPFNHIQQTPTHPPVMFLRAVALYPFTYSLATCQPCNC